MKICSRCGEKKGNTEFYTSTHTRSGLRSECKDCTKLMTRLYKIKTRNGSVRITDLAGNFSRMKSLCNNLIALLERAEKESLKIVSLTTQVQNSRKRRGHE